MIFYTVLGVVGALVVGWVVRSPVARQLVRGRGIDPGQWGSRLDHLADQGFEPSWNDDGGTPRASRVDPPHSRRRRPQEPDPR